MKINTARQRLVEGQEFLEFETDAGFIRSICAAGPLLAFAAMIEGPGAVTQP